MSKNKDFNKITISKDDEDRLWKDGVIVLDTSALCNLYHLTPSARDKIIEIFRHLKERAILPSRVVLEYNRHRMEAIWQPLKECYAIPKFLDSGFITGLNKFVKELEGHPDFHPYFSKETLDTLKSKQAEAEKAINDVRATIERGLKERKTDIIAVENNDAVKDLISEFTVCSPLSWVETMSIIRDGDLRYKHSIPPGYCDKENKSSIDRFGDLIIWKEILRYSKSKSKNIIFVSDDIKEDWVVKENEAPVCPREELIEEFSSETGMIFWSYTLEKFIEQIKARYSNAPDSLSLFHDLDAVTIELNYQERMRERQLKRKQNLTMGVTCDHCKCEVEYEARDFDWQWEAEYSDEREMGTEICYECHDSIECPECEEQHDFTFQVWEYPMGMINMQNIDAEGCEVNVPFNLTRIFPGLGMEVCPHCGEQTRKLGDWGMCQSCEDELQQELDNDD
ncbi:MAG: PIN domain-containing protein [Muribaculaceae bacterium]|nr:PIN domain-containing protein [Muribaculaceae bacterium]